MANMYRVGGNGNGSVTLSGDATTSDVLSGKTFYSNSTQMQTGAMTNNGAVSQTLDCGESYTVPEGYHNGSGTVSANSLASQTGVDSGMYPIAAEYVCSNHQGWVNGQKITGTFAPDSTHNGATPTKQTQYITPDSGKYFNVVVVEPIPSQYVVPYDLTPFNTSPTAVYQGESYKMSANGVTVESVTDIVPSNSTPVSLSVGNIYKPNGAGVAVESVDNLAPSNSTPATITSGNVYKATGNGVAVESITTVTPSSTKVPTTFSSANAYKINGGGYGINAYQSGSSGITPSASGTSFSTGWNYMNDSGYACTGSTPAPTEETLWTNSNSTTNFAAQTVTLNSGKKFSGHRYIKITFRLNTSTERYSSVIYDLTTFQNLGGTQPAFQGCLSLFSSVQYYRRVRYSSDTQVSFTECTNQTGGTMNNTAIPTSIVGIN